MIRTIRITLFVLMTFTASFSQAQEIVTDFHHENGNYFNMHNIVEACDNTLIVECPMFEPLPYVNDLGDMFYKVSLEGELLDSLFIESNNVPLRTLFEPVPDGNGDYFYARFEQEESDSTTYLRLTFIDADLNITGNIDVPIEDFLYDYIISSSDLFTDTNGDIIASYWCRQKFYMVRVGIDGTVKYRRIVEELSSSGLWLQPSHTNVFCNSPLTYYYLGARISDAAGLQAYFIDSLFQVTGEHQYYQMDDLGWFGGGMQEHIVPFETSTYLLSSRFKKGYTQNGTALAMFDS